MSSPSISLLKSHFGSLDDPRAQHSIDHLLIDIVMKLQLFFADQGQFSTGDYEEMMNKASCLSLVSNAILY